MLGGAAEAAQQWYMVEIIVFDTPGNEGLDVEHWPADPGELSIEGAVELAPALQDAPGGDVHAFRYLDRADLSLSPVRNTLRRSARYRPLLHAGWWVPGHPPNAARPVRLGTRLDPTAAGNGNDPPAVRGTVKVSVARYLHVELDLFYRLSGDDMAAAPEGTGRDADVVPPPVGAQDAFPGTALHRPSPVRGAGMDRASVARSGLHSRASWRLD